MNIYTGDGEPVIGLGVTILDDDDDFDFYDVDDYDVYPEDYWDDEDSW